MEITPSGTRIDFQLDGPRAKLRRRLPPNAVHWRGKRSFDVAGASLLLVMLLPLLFLIAIAVKVTSPGPVLFRQRRLGLGGRAFLMLKFRTMHPEAEARLRAEPELMTLFLCNDHKLAPDKDPRLTRLGQFLRRTSIDELPQLMNVILGDMSLVGPRPIQAGQVVSYGDLEWVYLASRPGLTGAWQVGGRSQVRFPHRARLDETYAQRCSLATDLGILLRTPAAVVKTMGQSVGYY